MKSAHELESMRIYLKGVDRVGVATVLTNLGLEDSTSLLEEEIMDVVDLPLYKVKRMSIGDGTTSSTCTISSDEDSSNFLVPFTSAEEESTEERSGDL